MFSMLFCKLLVSHQPHRPNDQEVGGGQAQEELADTTKDYISKLNVLRNILLKDLALP